MEEDKKVAKNSSEGGRSCICTLIWSAPSPAMPTETHPEAATCSAPVIILTLQYLDVIIPAGINIVGHLKLQAVYALGCLTIENNQPVSLDTFFIPKGATNATLLAVEVKPFLITSGQA
eukprot:10431726-Ditylum_brightwellii.AAC.1